VTVGVLVCDGVFVTDVVLVMVLDIVPVGVTVVDAVTLGVPVVLTVDAAVLDTVT
jgi:hypothetical protein